MCKVYLSLGSNQGKRFNYLQHAVQYIEQRIGSVDRISSYYETEPWGFTDETPFINQVIRVNTDLSASKVLERALLIEKVMGRTRPVTNQRYSGRTLDIDILFYNNEVIEKTDLIVPHKHIHERRFVLVPFREIAPQFVHPVLNKTISQLVIECIDNMNVKKLSGKDILSSVA